MAESDPLSQMRSQVDAAYAAADRLVREAEAAARERAADIPAAGFEGQRTQEERTAFPDIAALAGLLEALRALIDWWIARLEREREAPVEVQDIPID